MASALEKIMKGTLKKSDSQKTFSPWWEDVESKLLYTLMILGTNSSDLKTYFLSTPIIFTFSRMHDLFRYDNAPIQHGLKHPGGVHPGPKPRIILKHVTNRCKTRE